MREFYQPIYEITPLPTSAWQSQVPLKVNYFKVFLITSVSFFIVFLLGLTIFTTQHFLNLGREEQIIQASGITQTESLGGHPNQAVSSRIQAGPGYVGN